MPILQSDQADLAVDTTESVSHYATARLADTSTVARMISSATEDVFQKPILSTSESTTSISFAHGRQDDSNGPVG